jgi:hypothetical protein
MRKLLYALVLFALATPLLAKDPFAGTWKLNSEKTKYTSGTPAKEVILVIEETQDNNVQVTATGVNADGSPISGKYTYPLKGGTGAVTTGDFDSIVVKMTGTHTRELQYLKGGKAIRTRHLVVSEDGKTMHSTVKGTNNVGKNVAGTDFFDRQ